jgi:hypothetical protein
MVPTPAARRVPIAIARRLLLPSSGSEGRREKVTKEEFMQRVICIIATTALVFSAMNSLATAQQGGSTQQATTASLFETVGQIAFR